MIPALDPGMVARIVRTALDEDLGRAGDVTTEAIVDADRRARARLVARAPLVVAGLPVAEAVFGEVDATLRFAARASEGEAVAAGVVLADVWGRARPILVAERTVLNFLGRMCGIAGAARRAVDEVAGTGAIVLDTRKTAPGLRALDKYAVAAGGATNHRMGLHDAAMIKDTHRPVAPPIGESVARLLARGVPRASITVEVATPAQLDEAIAAGAGRVLLDNMDPDTLRLCAARAEGRIELEASGGLRPGSLRAVAETGVRFLSLGWLTHSAPSADVAMDLVAEGS